MLSLKIKIITKLILLLTAMIGLLKHHGTYGAITSMTSFVVPSFTQPAASTTSATPFLIRPNISVSGNLASLSATGSFNSCVIFMDDQTMVNGTLIVPVQPHTAYAYSFTCKNNDIQSVRYVGSFKTP